MFVQQSRTRRNRPLAERAAVQGRVAFPASWRRQDPHADAQRGAEAPAARGRLREGDHPRQRAGQEAGAREKEDGEVCHVSNL